VHIPKGDGSQTRPIGIPTSPSTKNSGLGRPRRKGTRKNLLATRICACVVNLHTLDHAQRQRDAA
jgi:hypothetical protein